MVLLQIARCTTVTHDPTMTQNYKLKFTDSVIAALPFGDGNERLSYRDQELPSLELRITRSSKTFYVCKWHQKNTVRVRLGDFPSIKAQQARRLANKALMQLASGVNPNEEKRALRDEMTLGELFKECLKLDFKPYLKSWKEYEANYLNHLAHWSSRPLSKITRQQVQALHTEIGKESGTYCANRVMALLSSLYNKAINRGYSGTNPVRGLKKFRTISRDRFLEADELPRFFKALQEEENTTLRDYVLISLLTGARRANVLSMRWSEVYLERGYWNIPETKNGTSQRVVLVPAALEVLKKRRDNGCDYVFPGDDPSKHLNDPKRGWKRILTRAGISNLRIHDLRRSLGSWQAATGASLSLIGKALNHRNVNSTAIYARLNLDPVRASVETATTAMLKAAGVAPVAEVVELPLAKRA